MNLALLAATLAVTASPSPLDRYLEGLETLRTTFTQTLVDAHGKPVDRASGTLVVVRPGRFRWEVDGGQLLVADGRNVWFYDRELEQVTVKPADSALSATPALLLSGTANVHENFTTSDAGRRDGLDWVLVEPKRADAEFRRALLGFKNGELERMIVDDKLGQTATIGFDKTEKNGPVAPGEVSFTPPPGADVIGKASP